VSKIGLKGASGLGDTIYGYPIVRYYAQKHDEVYYMTNYPELFKTIPNAKCFKHEKLNYIRLPDGQRQPIDIRFTYCGRKYTSGSSQFTDSRISAGVKEPIELKIPWQTRNQKLIDSINDKCGGKKVCIISAPYEPFGREDQWGAILRIQPDIMQRIVDKYKNKLYFILIGNEYTLHTIKNVNLNLINKTSVSDLFDLVKRCDYGISQIGNMLPLCECQGKKNFIIFSKKAMESENRFISAITPEKTIHYKNLNISVTDDNIKKAVIRFDNLVNV
jgi:hypothetical protein